MMIEATKLIKLPVAALDTQEKIGEIQEILVDPKNGGVLGFLVKTNGLFGAQKALAAVEVSEWDPNGLVTESAGNLVEPEEIIRIKEVLKKNILLLGMSAETENKKGLGRVENFLIDTDTDMIIKYYLRDLLGKSRIMSADKVISIDKVIVFADDETETLNRSVTEPQIA